MTDGNEVNGRSYGVIVDGDHYLNFVVDRDGVGEGVNGYPREHVYLVARRGVAPPSTRRAHRPSDSDLRRIDGQDTRGDSVVHQGLVNTHTGRVAGRYR